MQIRPVYWTYYNLAILYRDRGQIKDARWALEQSLLLKNDFVEARNMLVRLPDTEVFKKPVLPSSEKQDLANVPARPVEFAVKPVSAVPEKVKKGPAVTMPVAAVPQGSSGAVSVSGESGGQVFLTFDGGAADTGFDSIVASLKRSGVRTTFFLTGQFVRKYPEKSRQLLADGHEVANHSMNHPNMKNYGRDRIHAEIEAAEQVFAEVLGRRGAPFFRFPFGAQNKTVEKIVEELGYRPVYWHIDTIDWREDPVNTIVARVNSKLRRNAVILMHLGSKNGARALDQILEMISRRGFTIARLSDMDASQLAALP